MLVLEPTRRYTIEQIKRHRWMLTEVVEIPPLTEYNVKTGGTSNVEPNEDILRLMAEFAGIDPQKTKESLKKNSYDHISAIYLLLQDRVRTRALPNENSSYNNFSSVMSVPAAATNTSNYLVSKHGVVVEGPRRRPSSIAEQAMRKLGLSASISQGNYSREMHLSPRRHYHHMSDRGHCPTGSVLVTNNFCFVDHCGGTLMSSMMPLKDTNIRESVAVLNRRDICSNQYIQGPFMYNVNNNRCSSSSNKLSGMAPSKLLARDRECTSPYSVGSEPSHGLRESSSYISHEFCHPNRLINCNLDQNFVKQSTEDCNRRLKQVRTLIKAILLLLNYLQCNDGMALNSGMI